MPVEDLLPLPQAASYARTPARDLAAMAKAGRVTGYRVIGQWWFRRRDLALLRDGPRPRPDRAEGPIPAPRVPASGLAPNWDLLVSHDPDTLLSPGEVARIFRVSRGSIRRWAAQGRLPTVRTLGGHYRYPVRQLLNAMPDTAFSPHPGTVERGATGHARTIPAVAVLSGGPLDGARRFHDALSSGADYDGIVALPNPPGPEAMYVFVRGRWRHIPLDDAPVGGSGLPSRMAGGTRRDGGRS